MASTVGAGVGEVEVGGPSRVFSAATLAGVQLAGVQPMQPAPHPRTAVAATQSALDEKKSTSSYQPHLKTVANVNRKLGKGRKNQGSSIQCRHRHPASD